LTRPQSGDNKQARIKMLNRSGRITGLLIALVFLGAAGELRLSSGIEQRIDLRSSAAARQDEAANARRAAGRLLQAAERFGTGLRSWFSETGRLRSLQRHSPPLSAPDRRDPETIGRSFAQAHADLLDVQEVWIQNLELVARFPAATYSKQNFIKGIRTRPYSTDFSVNDLTYADFGRVASAPEVHADGEIWVEAMWELRARLIKKYGYEEARRRVAQLMINAMKRSPANPSFVDMRDSLISADQADHAGKIYPCCGKPLPAAAWAIWRSGAPDRLKGSAPPRNSRRQRAGFSCSTMCPFSARQSGRLWGTATIRIRRFPCASNPPVETASRSCLPDREPCTAVAKPADVQMTAQQDDGSDLAANSNLISLPGQGQAALTGGEIFPALPSAFSGWMEARSTGAQTAGFFVSGDHAQTDLSGALAAPPARDLVFAQVSTGGESASRTDLYVVNPAAGTADLNLCWHDAAGGMPVCVRRFLAPRTRLAAEVGTLFPSLPEGFQSGYLRLASDVEVSAVAVAQRAGPPYMLAAQQPAIASTLYGAQFASGILDPFTYETELNLVNASGSRRNLTIELRGDDGSSVSGPGIVNPRTVALDAGAQLHMRGDVLFGLPDPISIGSYFEGTVVVFADGDGLVGDLTFQEAVTHQFATSLPLDAARSSDLIFAQVAEGGDQKPYFTGIAMFNPNRNPINVHLDVFTRKGMVSGSADIHLEPGARFSQTLGQLVPGISQMGGYMRVTTAGGPVSSFAVYGDTSLDFLVSLPPNFIK